MTLEIQLESDPPVPAVLTSPGSAAGLVLTVQDDGEVIPAESGGSQPGVIRLLGPFPFAFGDAGINNGKAVYTPTPGDYLLNIIFELSASFNGTTPKADIGTFADGNNGIFENLTNGPLDVSQAPDGVLVSNHSLQYSSFTQSDLASAMISGVLSAGPVSSWWFYFLDATPLKVVVSQTGAKGGTAVGGSAGAGAVLLQVVTPSLT